MFGKSSVVTGWLVPDTGRRKGGVRRKDRNWDEVLPERESRLEGECEVDGAKQCDHADGVDETSRSYKGRSAVTPSFSPSLVSFIAPGLRNLDDGEEGSGLRPFAEAESRGNTPSSHEHDGYTPEFSRWSDSDSDSDSERPSAAVSFESATLFYKGHRRGSASWGHAPRRHGKGSAGGRDSGAPSRNASYSGSPFGVGLGISSMASSGSGGESPPGPRLASTYSSAASSLGGRRVVPRGPRPQYTHQREASYASPASESSATDSSFQTATDDGGYVIDDETDYDDHDQDNDATDGFLGVGVAHVEHVGAAVPQRAPLASHGSFGPEQSLVAVDPAATLAVPAADEADEDVRASLTFGRRAGRAQAEKLARGEAPEDDAPDRDGQRADDLWAAEAAHDDAGTTHDACDATPTLATVGRMATLSVSDADAQAELSEFESTPPPAYTPLPHDPLVNNVAHVAQDVAPASTVSSPHLLVTPTLGPWRDMDMAPSELMSCLVSFPPPLVPDESGLALHVTPPASADISPVDPGAATVPTGADNVTENTDDIDVEAPGSGQSTPCMTHSPESDPRSHLESPPSPATFGPTRLVDTPRKPVRQSLDPLDAHGDERPAPFARNSFGCGESDDEAGETRRWALRMASVTPRPSEVGTVETLELEELDEDALDLASGVSDSDENTVNGDIGGSGTEGDRARGHFFASLNARPPRSSNASSASTGDTEDGGSVESVAAAVPDDGDSLSCPVMVPTGGANGRAVLPQLGARRSFTSLSSLSSSQASPAPASPQVQRRRSFAQLMRIREDRAVDAADADDADADTGRRRRKVRQRGVGLRRTVLNPPEPEEDEMFSVDRPPSQRRLYEAGTCFVYDENGGAVCFGDLFPRVPLGADGQPLPRKPGDGPEPKTIVFFIRTFWCGQCQDYTLASISALDPDVLAAHNVRVVVIGPGHWKMLKAYRKVTKCPFELYTDAPRRLYHLMGMILPINFFRFNGERPGYHQRNYAGQGAVGMYRAFRHLPIGNAGNVFQLGGEFILSSGYKCDFAHRMMYMGDHMEAHEVLARAGVDQASVTPPPVSEGERAAREQLDREAREASQWREERARELERMRRKKAARRGVDYDDTWTASPSGGTGESSGEAATTGESSGKAATTEAVDVHAEGGDGMAAVEEVEGATEVVEEEQGSEEEVEAEDKAEDKAEKAERRERLHVERERESVGGPAEAVAA